MTAPVEVQPPMPSHDHDHDHGSHDHDQGSAGAEQPPAASRRGPAAWLAIALIRVYRWVFAWRSSPCRYDPTCSSYALEAVEVHGAARGTWLALRRLGRCHPWGGHGWDPVPPRKAS